MEPDKYISGHSLDHGKTNSYTRSFFPPERCPTLVRTKAFLLNESNHNRRINHWHGRPGQTRGYCLLLLLQNYFFCLLRTANARTLNMKLCGYLISECKENEVTHAKCVLMLVFWNVALTRIARGARTCHYFASLTSWHNLSTDFNSLITWA